MTPFRFTYRLEREARLLGFAEVLEPKDPLLKQEGVGEKEKGENKESKENKENKEAAQTFEKFQARMESMLQPRQQKAETDAKAQGALAYSTQQEVEKLQQQAANENQRAEYMLGNTPPEKPKAQ